MTGPNLPHNWITDQVWKRRLKPAICWFNSATRALKNWPKGFPSFPKFSNCLQLAQSGIHFEGFNPTFARGHMESIRDNKGAERILAFVRFLGRLNEHAEKKTLVGVKLIQPQGGSKHARIAEVSITSS